MKIPHLFLVFGLLCSATFHLHGQTSDAQGWTTILGAPDELKSFPDGQAEMDKDLLHIQSGNGVLVPQPSPNGAIRARFHFLPGTTFPQLRIRRSGDGGIAEASYYNLILFIRQGQSEVKHFDIMKILPRQQGQVIGTVHLPQPLRIGDQMDLEFSTVGNRLQVWVDGKPSLDISDDSISTGGYWGLASGNAWFSNVQVRSLSPDGKPASAISSALQVMTAKDPKLSELHAAYEAARQRDVGNPHQEAVKALNGRYQAALDRALNETMQASKLDDALVIRDEKKRVEDNQPLPPATASVPQVLKSLRETYRSALKALEATRDQAEVAVLINYDRVLEAALNERSKASDLDGSVVVKKMRELLQVEIQRMGNNAVSRSEKAK